MSRQTRFALQIWPFVLALALLFFARYLEQQFLPVVRDFRVTTIEQGGSEIVLKGSLEKIRSCELVGVIASVDDDGMTMRVSLTMLNSIDNPPRVFPLGTNYWGPWRLSLPQVKKGSKIMIKAIHSCHPAWTTTTKLTSFHLHEEVMP